MEEEEVNLLRKYLPYIAIALLLILSVLAIIRGIKLREEIRVTKIADKSEKNQDKINKLHKKYLRDEAKFLKKEAKPSKEVRRVQKLEAKFKKNEAKFLKKEAKRLKKFEIKKK